MPPEARHDQQLVFTLGDADFGIPVLKVKEILQWEGVTAVPGTPPAIAGVTNVRGAATPVIDLSMKFGYGARPASKRTCILVVETQVAGEAAVMGLKVDAVQEVLDLTPGDVEPPPSFGAGVRLDFLRGLARHGPQRFVLLLELDRVLSAADAEVAAFVASAGDGAAPVAA